MINIHYVSLEVRTLTYLKTSDAQIKHINVLFMWGLLLDELPLWPRSSQVNCLLLGSLKADGYNLHIRPKEAINNGIWTLGM